MMKNKIMIWLALSISIAFLRFFHQLRGITTSGQLAVDSFIIIMLCVVFGWLKRDAILGQMHKESILAEPIYVAAGVFITVLALLMPLSDEISFMLFNVILLFTGIFMAFFGSAVYLPSQLVFVYALSVSLPKILVETFGIQYAVITTGITTYVASQVYPVICEGTLISLCDTSFSSSSVFIDAGVSGINSLAIFLTVFALMLIDINPKIDVILLLFIFGILGTTVQHIFQLILLIDTHYHFGTSAMWTMDKYVGSVFLLVWLLIFIYVYLKMTARNRQVVDTNDPK